MIDLNIRALGLFLAMFTMPVSGAPCDTCADGSEETPIAESETAQPCPTEIEIQSYIWIEPNTGHEYKVLHLHCPDEDEA